MSVMGIRWPGAIRGKKSTWRELVSEPMKEEEDDDDEKGLISEREEKAM